MARPHSKTDSLWKLRRPMPPVALPTSGFVMSFLATAMARPTAIKSNNWAMILSSKLLVFSLCSVAGWAAPILYEQDHQTALAQSDRCLQYLSEKLEWKLMLWLLSFFGFYGPAWFLGDFPIEPCPTWQRMEVMDCKMSPAQTPGCPRHGCSVRSTLKSLGQVELNLVTLLYKLRRHKEALCGMEEDNVSKDLVIYTIEDEA